MQVTRGERARESARARERERERERERARERERERESTRVRERERESERELCEEVSVALRRQYWYYAGVSICTLVLVKQLH